MIPAVLPWYILLIIKLCVLLGLAIYGVFAGIMVRQEQLMANVLEESFEPALRVLTIVHFAAALGLFLLAIIIL